MPSSSLHSANGILVLLVVSVAINYVDRGALSVAAPSVASELKLSTSQMGLLFSAFFWSYASCQVVGGWLVDRYPVRWVYAGGFLLWSLATAAVGAVGSLPALLVTRFLLGAGESVAYPACSKFLAREFPEERRGFANAAIDAGTKIGPALSILVGGLVVGRFGWRALFVAVGLGSLIWLIPWLSWTGGAGHVHAGSTAEGPGWLQLLKKRQMWGTSLGMFSLGYAWYFLLSWLPSYLMRERGLTTSDMSFLGSIPFWGMAIAALFGGWTSDAWIRAGGHPSRVRRLYIGGGLLLCGAALLPAALVRDTTASVVLVTTACLCLGLFTSNVWAATQTLAGPEVAGKWTAIQNTIGNLGGVVSPLFTGWIADATGSFLIAFAVAAAILFAGAALYLTMVRSVQPVDWRQAPLDAGAATAGRR
ncbi:MAG: MFS transporter [Paludibaculum sp.]